MYLTPLKPYRLFWAALRTPGKGRKVSKKWKIDVLCDNLLMKPNSTKSDRWALTAHSEHILEWRRNTRDPTTSEIVMWLHEKCAPGACNNRGLFCRLHKHHWVFCAWAEFFRVFGGRLGRCPPTHFDVWTQDFWGHLVSICILLIGYCVGLVPLSQGCCS